MENNIRTIYKNRRRSLSKEERSNFSRLIEKKAYEKILSLKNKNILCFYPTEDEVDLRGLYLKLIDEGYNLYFPKTYGEDMDFFLIKDLEKDFDRGNYNIMEPKSLEIKWTKEDAICITPGLIFDDDFNRMGYGKGFYDRYFSRFPGLTKMGVFFEIQHFDKLSVHEYDVPLDLIITNTRIMENKLWN